MEYDAHMFIGNVFFSLTLTHHDNKLTEVEEVAEHLARKLGANHLYTEEKPD